MGLLGRPDLALSKAARRPGHALRFWGEITREVEKKAHAFAWPFFEWFGYRFRAPFAQSPVSWPHHRATLTID